MQYLLYYIVYGVVFGFVCHSILSEKNYGSDENPNTGFTWGFFLGILGLVVCCCKQRLEKDIENKEEKNEVKQKVLSQDLLEKGFWICPNCQKVYSQYAHSCNCGYNKDIKAEADYWICPQCSSRINICFSECSCGYKNEIEEKKTWECPICGTNNLEGNKECQCGYRIDIKEETWECPKCHSTNPIELDKCICGYNK